MRLLGIFNKNISVVNASEFGRKFGAFIKEPFVMGYDARFGSRPMSLAMTSGLLSSGCNVADLGFVPSPVVARIARGERVWGIHFSADPYPSEYVGVRIYDPSGRPWDGKIESKESVDVGRLANIDLLPNYMGELIDKYDIEPIKVVIDSANGPTGRTVPSLLRSLGMDVLEINSSLSPVTTRGYEPAKSNLHDLNFIVRRKRADLGIAFDGAGNKAGFIVPGGYISSGRAMAMLMKFNGFDRAVADIGATDVLDIVGTIERVRASEVKIAERLYSRGFELGGGTMGVAFSEWSFAPDAIMLTLELISLASKNGQTLDELNSQLPESYEDAVMMKVADPAVAIESARRRLSDGDIDLREGVKSIFEAGWVWLQPMRDHVRVSVEADTKDRMNELMETGKRSIKRFP